MLRMTFIEIHIRRRMASLKMLCFVTFTFIFKVKTFSYYALAIKIAKAVVVPGRFASIQTAICVKLFLLLAASSMQNNF